MDAVQHSSQFDIVYIWISKFNAIIAIYIKFSILHLSTLYKTIYRGLSFKGALHVTEISSSSKRLSRRLVVHVKVAY